MLPPNTNPNRLRHGLIFASAVTAILAGVFALAYATSAAQSEYPPGGFPARGVDFSTGSVANPSSKPIP